MWAILVIGLVTGAVYGANYVRDHEVYKLSAEKCSGQISALGQEVEQRDAEIAKHAQTIEELKSLPVR